MVVDTNQFHVVIGATGGTGNALVRMLAASGACVRAVSRGAANGLPAGVEAVQGDALDIERMGEVCRGASVMYNCVNPPFAHRKSVRPITF